MTAVHDRHSYDAEKRTALDPWGLRAMAIVAATKELHRARPSGRLNAPREAPESPRELDGKEESADTVQNARSVQSRVDMPRLPATAVRDTFSDTLNRVAFKGERIVLERHGKAVAALVSVEDLELLEDLEARLDAAAVRAAREEPGTVPYEEIRRKAGLA